MKHFLFKFAFLLTFAFIFFSCEKESTATVSEPTVKMEILPKLSQYKIFKGNMGDLVPIDGFVEFEHLSHLYTDSCEKVDFLYVPPGKKMTATSNGILTFPEGSIIMKTFFFYDDKRNPSLGKHDIETRILMYTEGKWIGGSYRWREDNSDADYIPTGAKVPVRYIDENGKAHGLTFKIASSKQCLICHNKPDGTFQIIGPSVKYINRVREKEPFINQLTHFQNLGILNPMTPSNFIAAADSQDKSNSLEKRARGYLDMNCVYCHSKGGSAGFTKLYFDYELPLAETGILPMKDLIVERMADGTMPQIRLYQIDQEGLKLVTEYMNSLPK